MFLSAYVDHFFRQPTLSDKSTVPHKDVKSTVPHKEEVVVDQIYTHRKDQEPVLLKQTTDKYLRPLPTVNINKVIPLLDVHN